MIRTLDRLVASTFAGIFALFILCIPILFILGDLTEKLRRYLDRDLALTDIGLGYLLLYPHFMLWSFPVAALIGSVFTIHSMSTHREIMAANGGGISFYRLVMPLWLMGVFLTAGAFLLGSAVPAANRKAAETLKEREVRREWRHNFVYQTENGETLTIQQLFIASRSIEGVLLERIDEGSLRHIWATRGSYTEETGWTFHEGYMRLVPPDGREVAYTFGRYHPARLTVPPVELLEDPPEEREMTYSELGRRAAAVRRSGGDPRELLVKREQKLAIPAATFVIVLLGAPLATTAKKGGAVFGVGISLGSTILYMMLLRFFGAIGSSGGLPPGWAAWTPNLVFFAAAMVLMARVRT